MPKHRPQTAATAKTVSTTTGPFQRDAERLHRAYHHAGHAVLAHLTERTIFGLRLRPSRHKFADPMGCDLDRDFARLDDASSDREAREGELMTALAGRVAEDMSRGRPATLIYAALAITDCGAWVSDHCTAIDIARDLGGDRFEVREALLLYYYTRTRALLASQLPALAAVAVQLFLHGTLRGPEVQKIIRAATQGAQ